MPAILPHSLDALEAHEIPAEFDAPRVRAFIDKARASGGAELANAQTIFSGLCAVLGVPSPGLKRADGDNPYCFEEDVKEEEAHRRIDVYKRGCFVFEAKQGVDPGVARADRTGHSRTVRGAGVRDTSDWLDAMRSGRGQAGNYAAHVTKRGDPKPPFLIVADVGHAFWIWSTPSRDPRDDYGDFEQATAFAWEDLTRPEVFLVLRRIWIDPEALDEEVRSQRVTAEIANHIGKLAVVLEKRYEAKQVGDFLMKCVFTMFAEDVGFLPRHLFRERLQLWHEEVRSGKPSRFVRGTRALWSRMRDGGDLDSGDIIRKFNGYLFRDPEALELTPDELALLLLAAIADWKRVSPAIFGTLLERALSPEKRQRLGAFYTPEAYIRRLVERTLVDPLRAEWATTRAEIEMVRRKGAKNAAARAREMAHAFRRRLTTVRVLDPACGSGNFLYVALKEMKRLEAEVVRTLVTLGDKQVWLDIQGETVHPGQFHGIEIDQWAAKIAELVIWIGYLQWQVSVGRIDRTPDPLLQDLDPIVNGDALIAWTREEPMLDVHGEPAMRAVGVSDKKAQRRFVPRKRLIGVTATTWPPADFVIGNPPFVGNKLMQDVLGSEYVEAVRSAYPDVPGGVDFVMYWWWRCADLLRRKQIRRFGLVTTNSIKQKLNRSVVAGALADGSAKLVYAIANHPWYDTGAAVRIAMTVADSDGSSVLGMVVDEQKKKDIDKLHLVRVRDVQVDQIHADLSAGPTTRGVVALHANEGLCFQGFSLGGDGFRLSAEEVATLHIRLPSPVVRPYVIGDALVGKRAPEWVIDFHGLTAEEAQARYPELFDHVVREVKEYRDTQNDPGRKKRWWLFGRSGGDLRVALASLPLRRYIATSRTSRRRVFVFLSTVTFPDTKVVAIACDDAAILAVLSSRIHVTWSNRSGGWLGVGDDPTYNHTDTFNPFPFPSLTDDQRATLRSLGERLESHRRGRQAAHESLELTDAYDVLAKVHSETTLDEHDDLVRQWMLVDTLRELHDEIDVAVIAAYGWAPNVTDDEVFDGLIKLNADRAEEENRGVVRWLRPEFQAPTAEPVQTSLLGGGSSPPPTRAAAPKKKRASALPWPSDLPDRIRSLTALLRQMGEPTETRYLGLAFKGAKLDDLDLTLRCAAAAGAVILVDGDGDRARWAARD